MSFFDENGDYWGNTTKPIIDAGNGRLNARSVKIFADGGCPFSDENCLVNTSLLNRRSQDKRCCGTLVI
jgi:hypothetical protein